MVMRMDRSLLVGVGLVVDACLQLLEESGGALGRIEGLS
jgi:hypothetical protein